LWYDIRESIRVLAWRLAWVDHDERRLLQRWQLLLERVRHGVARRAWSVVGLRDEDLPAARNRYDHWRCLLSDVFAPSIDYVLLQQFENEALREMTVTAIAIHRYRLRAGNLPADLAALVPEYLPQPPHDWMDGQPLRYQPHRDGTFTLYSVGADGRDDGGDPKPADRPRALSIWDGRDAVWPQPATEADLAAARKRP